MTQYFENLTINTFASKDKGFSVQITPNIESSAVTETSANLMINAPKDEVFNVLITLNVETLANDAFRHRLISLDEISPTEDMDTDTDEKDISNATDFSNAADPSNAADQISDNSSSNQSELATPTASIKRGRDGSCKDSVKIDFIFIDEISSFASVPYVFNSTIDIRYNSLTCKNLLIDSKTTF